MKYKDVVVGMRVSPYDVDLDEDIPVLTIKDAKSDGTFKNNNDCWYDLSDFYALDYEPFKPGDVVICVKNHRFDLIGLTLTVKEIRRASFKNKAELVWKEDCHNADYFEKISEVSK